MSVDIEGLKGIVRQSYSEPKYHEIPGTRIRMMSYSSKPITEFRQRDIPAYLFQFMDETFPEKFIDKSGMLGKRFSLEYHGREYSGKISLKDNNVEIVVQLPNENKSNARLLRRLDMNLAIILKQKVIPQGDLIVKTVSDRRIA